MLRIHRRGALAAFSPLDHQVAGPPLEPSRGLSAISTTASSPSASLSLASLLLGYLDAPPVTAHVVHPCDAVMLERQRQLARPHPSQTQRVERPTLLPPRGDHPDRAQQAGER